MAPIPTAADVARAGTDREPPGPVRAIIQAGAEPPGEDGQAPAAVTRVRFARLHAHGAVTYRAGDEADLPRQAAEHLIAAGAAVPADTIPSS